MLTRNELYRFILDLPRTTDNPDLYLPEMDDLYFLYSLVREKAVTSILEFGSGWSTCVLSLALQENQEDFGAKHKNLIRHPNPFRILTIDASRQFQEIALSRIPKSQQNNLEAITATPQLIELNGVICHKFDILPNFAPDLIYLDGPDHDQVQGELNSFRYLDSYTQPMGADILMIEPFLWPETMIVTDGRTANARFLSSRLSRNWQVLHDPFGDRTIFRLDETPLGLISEQHIIFRLEQARSQSEKELPEGSRKRL